MEPGDNNEAEGNGAPENKPTQDVHFLADSELAKMDADTIKLRRREAMANTLRNNQTVLRGFILSQICLDFDIAKAYKNTCQAVQDPHLDYQMFEEAYMRLSAGESVNFEPRNRSNDITFETLPLDVFDKICQRMSSNCVNHIRLVSSTIRNAVDALNVNKSDINVKLAIIALFEDRVGVKVNSLLVVYKNSHIWRKRSEFPYPTSAGETNGTVALLNKLSDDIQVVISNPRVKIEECKVVASNKSLTDSLLTLLQKSRTKPDSPLLHVKKLTLSEVESPQTLGDIISLMRPDTIEEIILCPKDGCVYDVSLFRDLDLPAAKKFTQEEGLISPGDIIHLRNFEEITVCAHFSEEADFNRAVFYLETSNSMKKFTINNANSEAEMRLFRRGGAERRPIRIVDRLHCYVSYAHGRRFDVIVGKNFYECRRLA